jgi:hypothetical protein
MRAVAPVSFVVFPALFVTVMSCTVETTPDQDGDGFFGVSDCAPNDAAVHLGADELCNGEDDDCDGAIDEEPVDAATWYLDLDGDGAGNPLTPLSSCDAPAGYVDNGLDCDDDDPERSPFRVWFWDGDLDGHGDPDNTTESCMEPVGYVAVGDDCDDGELEVHPGALRICNDGIDNACDDGLTDEPCELFLGPGSKRLVGTQDFQYSGGGVAAARNMFAAGNHGLLVSAASWKASGSTVAAGGAWLVPTGALNSDASESLDAVGILLRGGEDGDHAGSGVTVLDDMDGDGVPDIAIGANTKDTFDGAIRSGGVAHLISGASVQGLSPGDTVDLNDTAMVSGSANSDWVGGALEAGGDINGDGLSDLLIGATGMSNLTSSNAGAVVVLFGSAGLESVGVDELFSSTRGVVLQAPSSEALSLGQAMAGGDLNGDGFNDVVLGAWKHVGEKGIAYVISGASIQSTDDVSLFADFVIEGEVADDMLGWRVSVGDLAGDGYQNLVVSAPLADGATTGDHAGSVYIFPSQGPSDFGSQSFELAEAHRVIGLRPWGGLGYALAVGHDADVDEDDQDDDHKSDLLLGARAETNVDLRGHAWLFQGPFEGTISTADARATLTGDDAFSATGNDVAFVGPISESWGDAILIGAHKQDDGFGDDLITNSGAVFLLTEIGM